MSPKKLLDKYKSFPTPARASFWFLVASFTQQGISMVTTPIFTRLLSSAEYGQLGVFSSWNGIVTIFVSLNLSLGVHSQGLIKFESERSVFTSALQGLTITLVTLWTLVYFLFQDFWNQLFGLSAVQMLAMLLMIWTSTVFSFWANEQRVMFRYRALVLITLLVSLLKPILAIIAVTHAQDKVTARILSFAVVELLGYFWMFVLQIKRGKTFFSKRFWLYALTFNLPLIPHYLSQTVLNSADRIMIQRMVGYSEAGIYNLAYSVSSIMAIFNSALAQTLTPWMYQKIKQKAEKELAPIAYLTLLLIAAINLVFILMAPEVIAIFAPRSYYSAIWVIPPVAMSVYFLYCYDLFAKFAFYYEKTSYIMAASICGAALNVILNSIFIARFGYVAAGYTTLVCYMLYALAHYLFMHRICRTLCDGRYPYHSKTLLLITMVFMLVGILFLMTYRYPIIRYSLVALSLVSAVLMRRRIIDTLRKILALRRSA